MSDNPVTKVAKPIANVATLGLLAEEPDVNIPDASEIPEAPDPEPLPDPDDPLLRKRKRRAAAQRLQSQTADSDTDLGYGQRRDTLG